MLVVNDSRVVPARLRLRKKRVARPRCCYSNPGPGLRPPGSPGPPGATVAAGHRALRRRRASAGGGGTPGRGGQAGQGPRRRPGRLRGARPAPLHPHGARRPGPVPDRLRRHDRAVGGRADGRAAPHTEPRWTCAGSGGQLRATSTWPSVWGRSGRSTPSTSRTTRCTPSATACPGDVGGVPGRERSGGRRRHDHGAGPGDGGRHRRARGPHRAVHPPGHHFSVVDVLMTNFHQPRAPCSCCSRPSPARAGGTSTKALSPGLQVPLVRRRHARVAHMALQADRHVHTSTPPMAARAGRLETRGGDGPDAVLHAGRARGRRQALSAATWRNSGRRSCWPTPTT